MRKFNDRSSFSKLLAQRLAGMFLVAIMFCAWSEATAQDYVFPPLINQAEAISILQAQIPGLENEVETTDGVLQNQAERKLFMVIHVQEDLLSNNAASVADALENRYKDVEIEIMRQYSLTVSQVPLPSPLASAIVATPTPNFDTDVAATFVLQGDPSNPTVFYPNDPVLVDLVNLLQQ